MDLNFQIISGEGNFILLAYTVNYMMQSRDQSAAKNYLCDEPSMSFACRIYSIFALFILGNPRVFNMLRDGLHVLPWVKMRFQWSPTYGENRDAMNAHFNFWYQQVFHNRT